MENMYRIETSFDFCYKPIMDNYGELLYKYNAQSINNRCYIQINSLEDIFQLHKDLDDYLANNDDFHYDSIFGIISKTVDGEKFFEIKDCWD